MFFFENYILVIFNGKIETTMIDGRWSSFFPRVIGQDIGDSLKFLNSESMMNHNFWKTILSSNIGSKL